MFYTDQLKAHATTRNGQRKYDIAYFERNESTGVYEYVLLACIDSEGAHLAIAFDNSTNDFVLATIKPL